MAETIINSAVDFIGSFVSLIAPVQTELLIFVVSAVAHAVIFGSRRPLAGKKIDSEPCDKKVFNDGGKAGGKVPGSVPVRQARGAKAATTATKLEAPEPEEAIEQLIGAVEGALKLGNQEAIETIMGKTKESTKVTLIKHCGSQEHFKHAQTIFDACPSKPTCVFNALLDVYVQHGDIAAADRVMDEAMAAGVTDVVTYNIHMKLHVKNGDLKRARSVLERMRTAGIQPNQVTYNQLLDTACMHRPSELWQLIDEMRASGLQPTPITCSIILKSLQPKTRASDIESAMAMCTEMAAMDEVLFAASIEACIRVNRGDLLTPLLRCPHRHGNKIVLQSSKAYGSIIRGYGYIGNIKCVWSTWREMLARNIAPTSVTLGVMIEALVTNRHIDAGYELIQEMLRGNETKELVNAVIYNSVLKGYSHDKNTERVWAVYQEMLANQMDFSVATYNTLVDACARNCEMSRLPTLLQDMHGQNIQPNLITYSAILKAYCQENKIDKAYELLESMKQSTEFRPDEIMYNSLLDGCARKGMFDRGLALLKDMEEDGINPTNFTLSVLVKLCNRGGRLEDAFKMSEELSKRFGFKLNVYVYSNLVHACVVHKALPRAFNVLERMLSEGVRPNVRTYKILLQAYIAAGDRLAAVGLLRAVVGLPGAPLRLAQFGPRLRPEGGLPKEEICTVLDSLAAGDQREPLLAALLHELQTYLPDLSVSSSLKRRIAMQQNGWR